MPNAPWWVTLVALTTDPLLTAPVLSSSQAAAVGHSDANDWAQLRSKQSRNPPAGAGTQVGGDVPDHSTNTTTYGWSHDAQFVIRISSTWNDQLVLSRPQLATTSTKP